MEKEETISSTGGATGGGLGQDSVGGCQDPGSLDPSSACAPVRSSGRSIFVGNLLDIAAVGSPRSPSRRLRELTRTATPATPVGEALGALDIDPRVHRGIKAYKVCSNGKIVERMLSLSRANFLLFVTPRRLPRAKQYTASSGLKVARQRVRKVLGKDEEHHTPRYLDVSDITALQCGFVGTRKLELCKSKYLGRRHLCSITSLTREWSEVIKAAGHVDSGGDAIVSIMYGAQRDTLDLLIPDEDERKVFVGALLAIRETYHCIKENVSSEELLLRYVWYQGDRNKNGRLDKRELKGVMNRLNISHRNRSLKADYRDFVRKQHPNSRWGLAKAYNRGLDFKECLGFIRTHKNISGVWDNVFGRGAEQVPAEVFLKAFLHQKQHEYDITLADAEVIIAHLHATDTDKSRCKDQIGRLCLDRMLFDVYLHSAANDAYDPKSLEFDESEMDHSLSQYFISSSHNTYLMGDQLKSTSSVEMYMTALQRGCKCLEIDCWDGDGDGDDIVVYHGYTLTSQLAFSDIITGIASYIDQHPNTFPIILSLENHCSILHQQRMFTILKTKLGARLYRPLDCDMSKLPSPLALKGMVLIKGKRPPEPDIVARHDSDDEKVLDPYDEALLEPSPHASHLAEIENADNSYDEKIDHQLARATLFHGCAFQSFEKSQILSPSHMHSFVETAVSKILGKGPSHADMWVKYNHRHFTRIYPAGSRVDSSNYSPLLPWTLGCQMLALNFQTADASLILNDGFFRRNGGCGYLLKPKKLRGKEQSISVLPDGPRTLRIRVVCGNCLPKPNGQIKGEIIDPYVRVRLHDVVDDNGKNGLLSSTLYSKVGTSGARQVTTANTTRYVLDNGYSPVWRENSWAEFRVHNEMAMLQFCVRDKDYGADESVGEAAIPVSCLRSGYRCVRLYNATNTRSGPFDFATLLIEVEYVRPSLVELQLRTNPTPSSASSVETD